MPIKGGVPFGSRELIAGWRFDVNGGDCNNIKVEFLSYQRID
jgi:hypothetical protein